MFSLSLNIDREVTIDRPLREVYSAASDFNTWPKWSPWLCQEPTCPFKVEGAAGSIGHLQEWDGKFIGTGRMKLISAEAPTRLLYELEFIKPWKSKSSVEFHLLERGKSTVVTWKMRGTMPIFLFFMKKMMTAFVGNDYERGLQMLKEYVETGRVLTRVDVKGVVEQGAFYYIGKRNTCAIDDLGPTMEKDFNELQARLGAKDFPTPLFGFSFYNRYDMVKGTCDYTAAFGFSKEMAAPEGFEAGKVSAHRALEVDHYGPYRHLGNGWMTAYGRQRTLKKKLSKNVAAYEIYRSMPGAVPDEAVLTQIFLPIEGQ